MPSSQIFCDYQFSAYHRFDYTPADCKKYHETVEQLVLPLWAKILSKRKKEMGLKTLRPWDTAVDPLGRPALKPFQQAEDLISKCQEIFRHVHEDFEQQFSDMANKGLLDLSSRKGKAPGGYSSTIEEARIPFIFMNSVGIDDDVRTLLHEAGHSFHSLKCAHFLLADYRHGPMEFNEVASMGMELIADRYLSLIYNAEDEKRSRIEHLENIVYVLLWVAIIDAFQHWIYENPQHNNHQRTQQWLRIYQRFTGNLIDWEGFDDEQGFLWHRQLHIFEVPFYYIEYGFAQIGALQVWLNTKKDFSKAVEAYRNGLSLGGSRSLPELYTAAGIKFDFSTGTIAPLLKVIEEEIDQST